MLISLIVTDDYDNKVVISDLQLFPPMMAMMMTMQKEKKMKMERRKEKEKKRRRRGRRMSYYFEVFVVRRGIWRKERSEDLELPLLHHSLPNQSHYDHLQ